MATTSPELIKATQRFNQLFDEKNLKVDPFEKAIGVSQGTIKSVRNGRNLLSADCLIKIAKYWNVSADYLLCLTDEPTPLNTASIVERPTAELLPVFAQLSNDRDFVNSAKLYNAVSTECKKQICAYILGIASALGVNISQVLGR